MRLKSAIYQTSCMFILIATIHMESGARVTGSHTFNNHKNQSQSTRDRNKYKFQEQARGLGKDGIPSCSFVYEAPDGTRVYTRTQRFRSHASMNSEYRDNVKRFVETIESGDVKYPGKEIVGERIVGRHQANKDGQERYSIIVLWNSEREISYIESSSLNHILDFENEVYKPQK